MDVEVPDANGALDEWIDVAKRRKPCYLEFAVEQSEVENRLRCNESELVDPAATFNARNAGAGIQASSDDFVPFDTDVDDRDLDRDNVAYALLVRGVLPVSQTTRKISDIADLSTFGPPWQPEADLFRATSIKVDTNGSWWWKYAVNIMPERSEAGSSYWDFSDQSVDRYSLSVFRYGRWHKVSYNSSSPAIQEIRLTFDSGL